MSECPLYGSWESTIVILPDQDDVALGLIILAGRIVRNNHRAFEEFWDAMKAREHAAFHDSGLWTCGDSIQKSESRT
jgi:hypothetical protein